MIFRGTHQLGDAIAQSNRRRAMICGSERGSLGDALRSFGGAR